MDKRLLYELVLPLLWKPLETVYKIPATAFAAWQLCLGVQVSFCFELVVDFVIPQKGESLLSAYRKWKQWADPKGMYVSQFYGLFYFSF